MQSFPSVLRTALILNTKRRFVSKVFNVKQAVRHTFLFLSQCIPICYYVADNLFRLNVAAMYRA